MNKINWTTYKFRPSALGKLMTDPRSKSEALSETTKSYLLEIFIEEMYGRKRDISNKYIEKGNLTEEDSLNLISRYYEKLFIKNKEKLSNEFITGTPDITPDLIPDLVIDAKSSWDIFNFAKADGTDKDYYWQGQGYMWLKERNRFDLAYCLNNAPEHLIFEEKRHQMYKLGLVDQDGTPEFIKMEEEVEKNMKFDDIPWEQRIKIFHFERNDSDIERLKARIFESRAFLNTIKL